MEGGVRMHRNRNKKEKRVGWAVIVTVLTLLLGTAMVSVLIVQSRKSDCRHRYVEYTVTQASEFTVGERCKRCEKCGDEVAERVRATVALPQLYLDGYTDGISKTSACMMRADYFDGEKQTEMYASIKYQGHTSLMFDKKNYTIKFYEDNLGNEKHKLSVNGWSPTHKYCLKSI